MKKVLHALQRLEKWIIVIAFVIMVVAIFCQVVNRNIFKIPVSGFEEAAKYSMAYMVLLGTELGLRDGTQIAIKGVVDKLKGKVKKVIVIISQIIVVAFAAIMTKASFAWCSSRRRLARPLRVSASRCPFRIFRWCSASA